MPGREHVISDLSIALPSEALSETPGADRWMVIPYAGEAVSGRMLWAPVRSQPQHVTIPLPDLGMCRLYVGIYGSGEPPTWVGALFGRGQLGPRPWKRLYLRLSDEDWFDYITPEDFPDQPQRQNISESLWRTVDVTGKSLVLAPPRKEAFTDSEIAVAYIRLVPVGEAESWPRETKRLTCYFDGNFEGHFVDSAADVKTEIAPLRESDCEIVLWTTCREDTCYYPTKVGNPLTYHGMPGAYPHWMARDMQRMLERGEDPLAAACDVAHANGLRIFGSYRRMTCRVAPHVFPLHPEALFVKRPDLRCVHRDGGQVPQLSLTYPEVRQRMIDLFVEQARNYDLDGVHMFFCRGVPLVLFEPPFIEAFRGEHACDPRDLPLDDRRVWAVRARFFLTYLRDLRSALDRVGQERGRGFQIAMTVMNRPDTCAFFGMDVEAMVDERLVDLLIPFPCHYLPEELGEPLTTPDTVREFARITQGTSVRLYPAIYRGWQDGVPIEKRAAAFYAAGADGLQVFQKGARGTGLKRDDAVQRRLGHIHDLGRGEEWRSRAARPVPIKTVAGFRMDRLYGLPSCG